MEIVTKIAPICLALIMFGLGLGLTLGDFTRVLKNPRDFFVGFFCQVILLPIIAFILINIFSLSPESYLKCSYEVCGRRRSSFSDFNSDC